MPRPPAAARPAAGRAAPAPRGPRVAETGSAPWTPRAGARSAESRRTGDRETAGSRAAAPASEAVTPCSRAETAQLTAAGHSPSLILSVHGPRLHVQRGTRLSCYATPRSRAVNSPSRATTRSVFTARAESDSEAVTPVAGARPRRRRRLAVARASCRRAVGAAAAATRRRRRARASPSAAGDCAPRAAPAAAAGAAACARRATRT